MIVEKLMQEKYIKRLSFIIICLALITIPVAGYVYWLGKKAYNGGSREFKTLVRIGFKNFPNISMQRADMIGANLQYVNLPGANFFEADLSRANLQGANLQGANLTETNMFGANLSGANLQGASLGLILSADLCALPEKLKPDKVRFYFPIKPELITPEQISKCKNVNNIKGLTNEFLRDVKKLNPKLMEWWKDPKLKDGQNQKTDN